MGSKRIESTHYLSQGKGTAGAGDWAGEQREGV
jgi:hypothetical protein